MKGKKRLSASVAAELMDAAEDAVARGDAPTVSAWVSDALRLKVARDQRLRALAELIDTYEQEHGEISAEEMRAAARNARARAIPVRALGKKRVRKVKKRGAR